MLYIYNTLTKQKEEFISIKPKHVGIYVCGMTVYDYCHVGNARVFIFFDTVVKYLRKIGFDVNYVKNITDIDDKIIKRAQENNCDYQEIAEKFTVFLHEDELKLGVSSVSHEPRATEHIPQIIEIIQALLDKGYAYIADNGDVYYKISKFDRYGQLAHQDIENLRAGSRVEVSAEKQDPLDFVLWKMAKANEPSWPSPWGNGRPGWHIECSAMSRHYLGDHFDIHGGGADLQFPHHQNEVAQSEAACGDKFVNFWMHVGFVRVDNEKMSKSLGNFFTVREVLKKYHPEVLRYFILSSHYRSPLNYSDESLENAKAALDRIYLALRGLNLSPENKFSADLIKSFEEKFYAAMNDDFNTPEAFAVLFDVVREINRLRAADKMGDAAILGEKLCEMGKVFGILQQDPEQFLRAGSTDDDNAHIEELIKERNDARKNKDWKLADQIRAQLTAMGIVLEDTATGTSWRRSCASSVD